MSDFLSPEFRLVARSILAPDDELPRHVGDTHPEQLDWDRVHDLARHHSILGMMGARLSEQIPGLLPTDLASAADAERTRNLALHTAQAHQTAWLVRLLADAGVQTIVLKGVPLARTLFPANPEWRYSSDIDLLIDPADLSAADEVLRAGELARNWPDAKLTDSSSSRLIGKFAKDYQYVSKDKAHYLELHFRLTLNPHVLAVPFAALYRQSRPSDAGFGEMHSLDGPLLLAYLAWHSLADIKLRLKWFADVAWAYRRLGTDSMAVEQLKTALEIPGGALTLVRHVIARLIDDDETVPQGSAQRICRHMDRASPIGHARTLARMPRELSFTLLQMRLVSGWRARLWYVWHVLVDPRDVLALGGKELPAAVYALAGPFLSLWRFLRRKF